MKIVKGIGIFLICIGLFGLGYILGIMTMNFFYPGDQSRENLHSAEQSSEYSPVAREFVSEVLDPETIAYGEARAVASVQETLCVDTEYVVIEMDLLEDSVEQSSYKLPDKYIGMDREQFMEAMEAYESNPPLTELERGFINLDVVSFSRERVIVQMNYKFVKPGEVFYLAVYDGWVLVYLEDKSTVYIRTDIMLDSLPEEMQSEIVRMKLISGEEELYNFLESYSS